MPRSAFPLETRPQPPAVFHLITTVNLAFQKLVRNKSFIFGLKLQSEWMGEPIETPVCETSIIQKSVISAQILSHDSQS